MLILDDDRDLRETLSDWLAARCGARTVSAASLDEMKQQEQLVLSCSVALLDINLGAGTPSGLEAHAWLRQHGFKGRIAFLTGHAHTHPHALAAAELGDSEVLVKPVGLDRLQALVESAHVR